MIEIGRDVSDAQKISELGLVEIMCVQREGYNRIRHSRSFLVEEKSVELLMPLLKQTLLS